MSADDSYSKRMGRVKDLVGVMQSETQEKYHQHAEGEDVLHEIEQLDGSGAWKRLLFDKCRAESDKTVEAFQEKLRDQPTLH